MKKYFVLSVFIMLIGAFTNVQSQNVEKSTTPEKGVLVSGNVRLCNYEKGCLIAGNGMKIGRRNLKFPMTDQTRHTEFTSMSEVILSI